MLILVHSLPDELGVNISLNIRVARQAAVDVFGFDGRDNCLFVLIAEQVGVLRALNAQHEG